MPECVTKRKWWKSIWPPWGPSTSQRRLRRTLAVFREELEATNSEEYDADIADSEDNGAWYKRAVKLYCQAEQALQDRDPELGWRCYKASSRWLYYGLSDKQLRTKAQLILAEATDDKNPQTWRRASIVNLLAEDSGQVKGTSLDADHVIAAARILHGHQDNVYERQDLLRRRFVFLVCTTVVLLVIWMWSPPDPSTWGAFEPMQFGGTARAFWGLIFIASAFGAVFSALTSFVNRRHRAPSIPLVLSQTLVTIARLSIAPISALAATMLVAAGILPIGVREFEVVLALAFAAGFAERLVPRAIESWTRSAQTPQDTNPAN